MPVHSDVRFLSIKEAGDKASNGYKEVVDLKGNLVSAPFIEPHINLDTALTAGLPRWSESGTLFEGIRRWSERKESLTKGDVKERATQALMLMW